MHTSQRIKATLTSFVALTVFLPVAACDLANNYTKLDRATNSEMQDFRDGLSPREALVEADTSSSGVPELEPYVAEDMTNAKPMPLVSISVNQSIPLREALFELAKQADYDIELDPRISGSVIFTARNKPFDEVIDRLCEISGLRYKIVGDSLRVELDTPYSLNYKIDYLSFIRKTASNMKTDVSVASSSGGDSGGVGGGSQFQVDSSTNADFWAELDANLKQILESNSNPNFLRTAEDPLLSLTATAPTPNTPPVPPIDAAALSDVKPQAGDSNVDWLSAPQMVPQEAPAATTADQVPVSPDVAVPAATSAPTPAPTETTPAVAATASPVAQPLGDAAAPVPQQTTLKIESLPTNLATSADKNNSVSFTPAYSINKQAGIISVYANERVQKKVEEYLRELRRASTSQVLIEAKVLEVSLSDEFSSGINWSMLDDITDIEITGSFLKPALTPSSTNLVSLGISGDDVSTFVRALSRFGTVHALASPRLTVLNNQAAVLNVAKNQVYFEVDLDVERTSDGNGGFTTNTTIDSEIKTVPEGILINVLPSIDLDKRMVAMQVRPTVTKITDFVNDPGVAYVAASNNIDVESQIPIVNVQEIDSVMRLKDKNMMVLGGLLQDNSSSTQEGVPVLKEIPLIGGAFRNQVDAVKKTELVVFLKATILDDPTQSVHQTDRELYRTFSQDRRPEKM